ncbi:hypothetical protein KIPB_003120 [Kipferlia bialata]|uniref:Uncharacterized protein n=1 Tax=Kipferlia bialata TaxID=797122 RepID=A0A391NUC9_9EUKA|nr:hypothetical protein KIPB_006111 [Kipferlia bialata]GIQ82047.1 hypothetical protein KIPB_003120 [Kipferlia bialata]|eukprot:g3120.t1
MDCLEYHVCLTIQLCLMVERALQRDMAAVLKMGLTLALMAFIPFTILPFYIAREVWKDRVIMDFSDRVVLYIYASILGCIPLTLVYFCPRWALLMVGRAVAVGLVLNIQSLLSVLSTKTGIPYFKRVRGVVQLLRQNHLSMSKDIKTMVESGVFVIIFNQVLYGDTFIVCGMCMGIILALGVAAAFVDIGKRDTVVDGVKQSKSVSE